MGAIPVISYDWVWVFIPLAIYTVGYFHLSQPELLRVPTRNGNSSNRLTDDEVRNLNLRMASLFGNEKLYLKKDLTLTELSTRLQTTTNNLSWFLNNVHGCTFYDYINKFRIKEFLQRLEKGDHTKQTILSLSLEAGFNSKSTFNKAFKVMMNDTPSRYIRNFTA